jgi:hypothetical protein
MFPFFSVSIFQNMYFVIILRLPVGGLESNSVLLFTSENTIADNVLTPISISVQIESLMVVDVTMIQ